MELGTYSPDNLIGGDKKLVTEDIYIPSGDLKRGTVLGRVIHSVPVAGTADGGNTGNGTVTLVSGGAKTKKGTYSITNIEAITNGGKFQVLDPDGKFVGEVLITAGAGGTGVFRSDEINFTITDGGTDFALADSFTVEVTDGVPATGTADGGNTGNGTMTAVKSRRGLIVGVYTITCISAVTNGGIFSVVDPNGNSLANAVVGTPFISDQLTFLLNDGGTDFIVGDSFTLTVTQHVRQCRPVAKDNSDGSSIPYCVLSEDVDASVEAKKTIGYLEGQFNERALLFGSNTTVDDVRDLMRDVGLIVVPSVPAGSL